MIISCPYCDERHLREDKKVRVSMVTVRVVMVTIGRDVMIYDYIFTNFY